MTLSKQDTATAYAQHRSVHERRAWTELADLFADDGVYTEPFFGKVVGRAAIREFLRKSMSGLEEWMFPLQWTVVTEGRVVIQWHNQLPNARRDGTPFAFRGISNIVYNGQGMISLQEDSYDRVEALRVIAEARSPVVERFNAAFLRASNPLFGLAKRLTGM